MPGPTSVRVLRIFFTDGNDRTFVNAPRHGSSEHGYLFVATEKGTYHFPMTYIRMWIETVEAFPVTTKPMEEL